MINKPFKDLNEGDVFTYNNAQYKKIASVKVSCCRSLNAEQVDNSNMKIFIQPLVEVQINDQL